MSHWKNNCLINRDLSMILIGVGTGVENSSFVYTRDAVICYNGDAHPITN